MMRVKLMIASALAVSMVGVPAVFAQGATNAGADTTCADFVAMDADAQAALVSQLQAESNAGAASGTAGTVDTSSVEPVVTACQNNTSLTVGQAISQTPVTAD
jgi:hypothetical protein